MLGGAFVQMFKIVYYGNILGFYNIGGVVCCVC